jgi:hypothetical protein
LELSGQGTVLENGRQIRASASALDEEFHRRADWVTIELLT